MSINGASENAQRKIPNRPVDVIRAACAVHILKTP
jgi:hypothetical protein